MFGVLGTRRLGSKWTDPSTSQCGTSWEAAPGAGGGKEPGSRPGEGCCRGSRSSPWAHEHKPWGEGGFLGRWVRSWERLSTRVPPISSLAFSEPHSPSARGKQVAQQPVAGCGASRNPGQGRTRTLLCPHLAWAGLQTHPCPPSDFQELSIFPVGPQPGCSLRSQLAPRKLPGPVPAWAGTADLGPLALSEGRSLTVSVVRVIPPLSPPPPTWHSHQGRWQLLSWHQVSSSSQTQKVPPGPELHFYGSPQPAGQADKQDHFRGSVPGEDSSPASRQRCPGARPGLCCDRGTGPRGEVGVGFSEPSRLPGKWLSLPVHRVHGASTDWPLARPTVDGVGRCSSPISPWAAGAEPPSLPTEATRLPQTPVRSPWAGLATEVSHLLCVATGNSLLNKKRGRGNQ